MELDANGMRRYARQIILPQLGVVGQKKICAAKVLCIGVGGLGSPAALYLAAAGVGHIGIVDFDRVDSSNLHRQVLHRSDSVGQLKTDSAKAALSSLNPAVSVHTHPERLCSSNASLIFSQYDIILDGTDNFSTRYLASDVSVFLSKPYIYGSVFQFEGQVSVFAPHLGAPCYRCLYPEPPPPDAAPSCSEAGVLGTVPGIIGILQATESLKLITGIGTLLLNRLLLFDALNIRFREIKIRRDPGCPVCGQNRTITSPVDYEQLCGTKVSKEMKTNDDVSVQDLKKALDNPSLGIKAIDVREPDELEIASIQGVALLPLGELPQRFSELDSNQAYYVFCKAGGRSARAVAFLRQQGFKNVRNVRGGILAWSEQIDPSVPKY